MNTANNEIDIVELYGRTVKFIKNYWLFILISVILGGGFGLFKAKTQPTSYQGNIIISSKFISKDDLYQEIFPFIYKTNQFNSQYFAEVTNTENDVFKGISNVFIDTSALKSALILKVNHKDSLPITKMGEIFSDFYNKQPDFQAKFKAEKENARFYLELIDKQLQNHPSTDNKHLQEENTSDKMLDLFNFQSALNDKLQTKSIVTVNSKSIFKVEKKSSIMLILLWAIVFAFFAFILALLRDLDKASKKRQQAQTKSC